MLGSHLVFMARAMKSENLLSTKEALEKLPQHAVVNASWKDPSWVYTLY